MSSPFPTLLICAGYIYFIKYLGPRLMRDRRPFELKGVIIFYNIIQLLLNIYLVYKVSKYTYIYLYIQYIQLIYVSNSISCWRMLGSGATVSAARFTQKLSYVYIFLNQLLHRFFLL